MQLQTHSGLTSPNGAPSTAGGNVTPAGVCLSSGSTGGASTPGAIERITNGGTPTHGMAGSGTGSNSAAVSPILSGPGSHSPAIGGITPTSSGLSFSASSLMGSSVTPCSTSGPMGGGMGGMTDPVTGQLLADCDPARLAALSYPRLGAGGLAPMYSAASYPSTDQNPYPSIAMENTFYGTLGNPGATGTAADMAAWSASALPPTAGYYSYDHPTLAAYGYGGGYDLAARRKNATRESTATLKAWLNEHKKNPYPTKGEKIMLAIITKMTLTQVSTWFANARRRLKKENKMTWEPKNKLDDEDVDVSDDDDKNDDDKHDDDPMHRHLHRDISGLHGMTRSDDHIKDDESKSGIPIPPSKPKIWSLADTAVCKTPPPSSQLQQQQQQLQQPHHQQLGHWGHASSFDMSRSSAAAMSALRNSNMFGMSRPDFSGMMSSAASQNAHSGGSSDLQADTPPHTPPNNNNKSSQQGQMSGLAGLMGGAMSGMFNGAGAGGYNGLHNGYGMAAVSAASAAAVSAAQSHDASKLLPFQGLNSHAMNSSSFKMM